MSDGLGGSNENQIKGTGTGSRGGYRPGAGRKRKTDKNATAIEKAEKQIRDRLPEIVEKLIELAMGGVEVVEEKHQPGWIVLVQQQAKEKKRERARGKGAVQSDEPEGIEIDAETVELHKELFLIERKVSYTLPDKQAAMYLADRIMGKPVSKIAPTTPDGKEEYGGASDTLTDEARINRLAAIFDLARARRNAESAGHPPNVGSPAGSSDDGGTDSST
jgi:hypothetical protein